jgi:adenylate cyclase
MFKTLEGFFTVLLFFAVKCYSQNQHKIDSLEGAIKQFEHDRKPSDDKPKDSIKINILYPLGKEYWSSDEKKSMDYAGQIMSLSEKIGYKKGICEAYWSYGYIKSYRSNYAEALDYLLKGLKVAEDAGDKRLIATSLNYIGLVYNNKQDYKNALGFLKRSILIAEEGGYEDIYANIINNIGNSYSGLGDNKLAMENYQKSAEIAEKDGNMRQYSVCLIGVGEIYGKEHNYEKSLEVHEKGLKIAEAGFDKNTLANCLNYVALDLFNLGNNEEALKYETRALKITQEINAEDVQKDCYFLLEQIYAKNKDFKSAFDNEVGYDQICDSIYKTLKNEKFAQLQMEYDFEKKQAKEKADQEKKDLNSKEEIKKRKYIRYGIMGGMTMFIFFLFVVFRQKKKITDEKHRSDELLHNILPEEVAKELKETGVSKAKRYELVTVMFTDFKDFTRISEQLTPEQLVTEIDYCFRNFDYIINKYGIEKIKTMGDSYMCAGGIPKKNKTNPEYVVKAAIEIRDFMVNHKKEKEAKGGVSFEIRIGINSGQVVAGIVGVKKFAYDIWGDTVNLASKIETAGEPGKVNISENTYLLVKDKFNCIKRGKIMIRNKGEVDMYFVNEQVKVLND